MYRIRSSDGTPLKITQATLRSHSISFRSGHLTRAIRFSTRLVPHPNFAPFCRKTSYSPDVK
jgi:hypothetical protein